jgi:hypothetical protein
MQRSEKPFGMMRPGDKESAERQNARNAAAAATPVAPSPAAPPATAGRRKTRRRRSNTIRMKKSEYLREHHHLFRVLRNPTRRALNAELRKQKRELKERGLKG